MKLLVKNKLFSLGRSSVVTDENNKIVYKVKGSLFSNIISHTHKKKVKDASNKTLFVVRNKFWHRLFHKSALIYRNGKKIARIEKSYLVKNGYDVTGATEPISIVGSGWNLDIMLGENKIGNISRPSGTVKDAFRLTDAYILDVVDPADAPFLVAVVIAIDNIYDSNKKQV